MAGFLSAQLYALALVEMGPFLPRFHYNRLSYITHAMIIIIAMFTTVDSITGPYQRANCSLVPTFRSLQLLSIMLIQHHPPANPYVSVTKGIQNRKNGTRTDETMYSTSSHARYCLRTLSKNKWMFIQNVNESFTQIANSSKLAIALHTCSTSGVSSYQTTISSSPIIKETNTAEIIRYNTRRWETVIWRFTLQFQ